MALSNLLEGVKRRSVSLAAALSLSLSSCGATREISRRDVGYDWVRSNQAPLEEVLFSKDLESQKREHKLGDLDIDYEQRVIAIPVDEVLVGYTTIDDTVKKTEFLQEVRVQEVTELGPRDKEKCESSSSPARVLLSVSVLGAGAAVVSENNLFFIVPIITTIPALVATGVSIKYCSSRESTRTVHIPTGRTKEEYLTEEREGAPTTSPSLDQTQPAQGGSVLLSGTISGPPAAIKNGQAVFHLPNPALQFPYLFTNSRDKIPSMVDISWIKKDCRDGVLRYVRDNAQPISGELHAETRAPAGEEETYKTDNKNYAFHSFKAPAHEEIIDFVVQEHINRRIQTGVVLYYDLATRSLINNLEVSLTPIRIPSPADLVSVCFESVEDQRTAMKHIKPYRYDLFDARVNGEITFPVFVPSTFRISARNPAYDSLDEEFTFTFRNGPEVKERYMSQTGSKHRVKTVPE